MTSCESVDRVSSARMWNRARWRETASVMTILYAMVEWDTIFSTVFDKDHKHLEPILQMMHQRELVGIKHGRFVVLPRGEQLRDRMVGMYHQAEQFEVFGAVRMDLVLPDDVVNSEQLWLVKDHLYDPRFQDGPGAIDMRLAMMSFITERLRHNGLLCADFDPHIVVFMQKLMHESCNDDMSKIRFDQICLEVERVIDGAYQWRSMVPGEETVAATAMRNLYQAGMAQHRKLEGKVCNSCEMPLAMFDYHLSREGRQLDRCPNPDCGRDFTVVVNGALGDYECPKCRGEMHRHDHMCRTCHAVIGWNGPRATIDPSCEDGCEPLVIWRSGYCGYTPHVFDPIDPFVVGTACCLILRAMLS